VKVRTFLLAIQHAYLYSGHLGEVFIVDLPVSIIVMNIAMIQIAKANGLR